VTLSAQSIPAVPVASAIARDIAFESMQRPVRRGEAGVQEEGLGTARGVVDECRRVAADRIGQVEVLALGFNRLVVAG
jgi:hypothetical protein